MTNIFENADFKKLDLQHSRNRILIAAHRGSYGGAIPENTIESYKLAINSGADIIEADVARTKDGKLVMMHGPKIDEVTNGKGLIAEMMFDELEQLRFLSAIHQITDKRINTLDEVLLRFKGQAFINLDRSAKYLDQVFDKVKQYGMESQAIIKTAQPISDISKWLEAKNYEPLFIPIIKDINEINNLLRISEKARIPAVELVFDNEETALISDEIIKLLHNKNIKVWLNAIDLKEELSGGHNDTISLLGQPEKGWGWLINKGADIIQTDWVTELDKYLHEKGCR